MLLNCGVGEDSCESVGLQGDIPDPGVEPGSPVLRADSLLTELSGKPETDII